MPKPTTVRLSKHISPSRYKLTLKPNLDDFTFSGEETIFLTLTQPTKTITLHAHGLNITDVFAVTGKQSQAASKISYNTKAETATFTFTKAIPANGKTNLTLKFTGIIADNLRGFYRSKYDHNGITKHLGATQFEATDARKAFPCFDEPAHKAIFDITFIVPEQHTVVSNTIEQSIAPHSDGFKIVQFAPTPKMSTYLVAYIIGELESVETTTKDGTIVRIFTTPGKSHEAAFALDTTKRCLEFFNDYFGIKYPLPVLDSIAVPDFSSGAMENWGAITYREQGLLFNEATGTILRKQYIAMVIAHELSHQWFGNLVTMEWWTHLWLNEGFASYISYVATDHLFPEWQVWTKFATDDLAGALELDSLENTHPVEIPVHHPSEIGEIFDAISYDKGACLLRMLSFYIGADKFRDSLRYYLKKHAYKNTQTEDLWAAFERISKKPVAKVMKTWTSKPGYPVVSVAPSKKGVSLSQKRYTANPKAKKDSTLWGIPVQAHISKTQVSEQLLLSKMAGELPLNPKTTQFVKLNPGEEALYRTAYHKSLIPGLVAAIERGELNAIDRLGIIRDMFALNRSGEVGIESVLTLLKAYQNDTSYIVWTEIAGGLWWIEENLIGQTIKPQFRALAHELFAHAVTRVGWEVKDKETHTQTLLRALLIGQAGHYGHKPTIQTALTKFRQHASGKQKLPPDLESNVYRIVAEQGSSADYSLMLKLFEHSHDIDVKQRLINGLTQFQPKSLAKKTLQLLFSNKVRSQDRYLRAFTFLTYNAGNHQLLWQILNKNWQQVLTETKGTHLLTRVIEHATHLINPVDTQIFTEFIKKHPTPENKRTVAQTLEAIKIRQAWVKREVKGLRRAIEKSNTKQ